jgi:hypothetical protein
MWVIASTMHMEGKAKVWYEAYRLRQTVGDWYEFMDNVESHFADLPTSVHTMGTAHLSVHVHASEDISPATTTKCANKSPLEVMVMDKADKPITISYDEEVLPMLVVYPCS